MTNLTNALKASVDYEQGKRSITNLLAHKPDDLSVMIDTITTSIKECESIIGETERTINSAEDMAEIVEVTLRESIADKRQLIENLCAWRIIFLSAWTEVNKKKALIK